MTAFGILRRAFLMVAILVIVPGLQAQQPGQPGSGGGTGGSTGGGAGGITGGSTGGSVDPGTSSRRGQQPGLNTPSQQQQQRRQRLLFISGTVVLEDGTPPPSGAVIERVCNGQPKKEAYVDSTGYFAFQFGANNNNVMPDASDNTMADFDSTLGASRSIGSSFGLDSGSSMELMGCELRAQLAGYRSSVVILKGGQMMGQMDVGTIVLYPIAKVPGTMVSLSDLQAPKDAKKAFEKAQKAFQKKKLDEAEGQLRAAVDLYPRYAAAWFGLGQVYQSQNRSDEARVSFLKAVEIDTNYVRPYIELARLAGGEQKWQQVVEITDRALALDPLDFPEGFFLNSLANYYLNNLDAAERSALKAQRIDSSHRYPQAHLILANIFQKKEDAAAEAEQLRSYLKFAPTGTNAPQAQTRLAQLEASGAKVAQKRQDRK